MTNCAPRLLFVCSVILLSACGDGDHRPAPPTVTSTAAPPATATATPNPLAQACTGSGGTVGSALCCLGSGDFAPSCGIGACGCAPAASHQVARCDCPSGTCWDGDTCRAPATPTPTPTPDPQVAACTAAGGVVTTRECCAGEPDFPDTCGPPRSCTECFPSTGTRQVTFCDCPTSGDCWNGSACTADIAL